MAGLRRLDARGGDDDAGNAGDTEADAKGADAEAVKLLLPDRLRF